MSDKRVLLVVRADSPHDPKRQLEWLEHNIFPRDDFPKRQLAYVGSLFYLAKLDECWRFDCFDDYQDLYSKLRGEGYFTNTYRDSQHHFDFALLVHIRKDHSSGGGYGLEETRGERTLLRAMLLAARGNVLFCDWGLPMNFEPGATREQLLATRKLNQYIYVKVHSRLYPELTANVPFTKVIDHFLTPVPESDAGLPEQHMDAINRGIERTLFNEYQLKLARWNAWWNLYFAADGYVMAYHRWIHFCRFQMTVIYMFEDFRAWTVSSSWFELFIDTGGYNTMALLYGILARIGTNYVKDDSWQIFYVSNDEIPGFFIFSVTRYTVWMILVLLFLDIKMVKPEDRIPILEKMRGFLPYTVLLPIFDVLVCVWWKQTQEYLVPFFVLWTSLAFVDLASMWFFVPFARNCVSIGVQALVAVALFALVPDVNVAAKLIVQQPLYVLPLFRWNRLHMNREVQRTLFFVPWMSSAVIVFIYTISQLYSVV